MPASVYLEIPRTYWTRLGLLVLALVAVPFLYLYQLGRETAAAEAEGQPRSAWAAVAVLPFTNLSGNLSADWLSHALSEMLTTELSAGGKVILIKHVEQARAALVLPCQPNSRTGGLQKLHEVLGADLIIDGRYLAVAHRIRWDLQVIEVPSGKVREEQTLIGTETDLLDLVTRAGSRLRADLEPRPPLPGQS